MVSSHAWSICADLSLGPEEEILHVTVLSRVSPRASRSLSSECWVASEGCSLVGTQSAGRGGGSSLELKTSRNRSGAQNVAGAQNARAAIAANSAPPSHSERRIRRLGSIRAEAA